ncbi:MAG TPA: arylesterase [Croceibacterium sp.]|nr:arylesterase [Croceibacterium sp.]
MKCRALPAVLALAVTACSGDPEAVPSGQEGSPVATAAEPVAVAGPERRILAFGDSLFAGYGVGQAQSYPDKLQAALRARGIDARLTNAGVSGDTTAAGLQRIEFVLDGMETPPDLAIVELGGNDLLRGISPAETRENLGAILAELQERGIPVLLMGMRAPPNLGEAFVKDFDGIYPDLAQRYGAALVPFFLEPVYDKPALIQPDRVHPTAAGIDALVAATVDEVAAALPDA